ncbi:hypothetical protein EN858_14825 [Mesorhizobium sp. M4B.F.Ca.ET.215.01.1.1]|uniref:hypothetical protein n=1 Tax=unclassified Mesorhizobium TaxID=325217 RepID=UPI0010935557|nr:MULTISPECIES: hypothetical protein [unclassified Mesorhizobium]TGQ11194.1 hypothetical protein EN858_14825 [Mesorhizobium sp. M4B.F.Ca.ET.215.01.1.1]TGR04753.1 hypothetical protein EN846_13255 [Mesorhizobium sp. M4B.F.Ca.ET.203.01.1.1]
MDHHTEMLNAALKLADEPSDGYGAGFLEYQARTIFRDLARIYGHEGAKVVFTEIMLSEASRKRITIDV